MRVRNWIAIIAALSCGSDGAPSSPSTPIPAALRIVSGNGQSAIAATALTVGPTIVVTDSTGRPVPGVSVAFNVVRGNGWVVNGQAVTDAQGQASTDWYVGTTSTEAQLLEARAGSLAVTFAAISLRPIAGATITGANGYVEWIPGDMPIVVSAPHGGILLPTEIPDRTTGTTTRDLNTDELAHEVVSAFVARFGKRPHLIVCKLHRRKLDANREIVEAAAGNPVAQRAWREYHGFIEASANDVRLGPGLGFYVDLHGHGHDIQRLELGYLWCRETRAHGSAASARPDDDVELSLAHRVHERSFLPVGPSGQQQSWRIPRRRWLSGGPQSSHSITGQ